MGVCRGLVGGAKLQSSIATTSSSSSSSCVPALVSYSGLKKNVGFGGAISSSKCSELRVVAAAAAAVASKGAAVKGNSKGLRVQAAAANGAPQSFDYDVVIIGAGVGGHGAALHAVEKVN